MLIAVDMTDYIPGGANGGIVPLTVATLKELSKRDNMTFVILTTRKNHAALKTLDSDTISRFCIIGTPESEEALPVTDTAASPTACEPVSAPPDKKSFQHKVYTVSRKIFKFLAPEFIYKWLKKHRLKFRVIKDMIRHPVILVIKPLVKNLLPHGLLIRREQRKASADRECSRAANAGFNLSSAVGRKVDLLYCPFTAVHFYDNNVPIVSTLHDIQHVYCPWFFSEQELHNRDKFYKELISLKPTIMAVSDFSRNTFIDTYSFPSSKIITVYNSVQSRLCCIPTDNDASYLESIGVEKDHFLFYPANFWPHKNHRGLLTAFSMFCHKHPQSDMKLVLTGFPVSGNRDWLDSIDRMGLREKVLCAGYVTDTELAALFRSCAMMVFPSFFEGFGMPITEAMDMGAAVLCSNVTSLPEVGGDCAFYFDPYDPNEILQMIEYVMAHPEEVRQKKAMYKEWLERFSLEKYVEDVTALFRATADKEISL